MSTWDTQKFVDPVDVAADEALVEELYWSQISRPAWYQIDQSIEKNIYGEPVDQATIDAAYTLVTPSIPIHIKLNPEQEYLEKYGYDRQRDAVLWFCQKILRDRGLASPKNGDIVIFAFEDNSGETVAEYFEIQGSSPVDFQRQTFNSYQISADAIRIPARDFS